MCGSGSGRWILLIGAVLLLSTVSEAQERGHAAGVFGWTFGEETSPLYGGQFGIGLGDNFAIIGGVERLEDTLTGRYALFLRNLAGLPGVDINAEVPSVYGGGGLRFTLPGMRVSPFVQGELGATQIDPNVQLFLNGEDVTNELVDVENLGETAFTFVLGAGLRADFGDVFLVEATFKFFDILTEEELRLNRLSFAVGARF